MIIPNISDLKQEGIFTSSSSESNPIFIAEDLMQKIYTELSNGSGEYRNLAIYGNRFPEISSERIESSDDQNDQHILNSILLLYSFEI
jgi:hypothetical protein